MPKTRIPIGLLIAITAGMIYGQGGSTNTPVISSAQANFAVTPATLTINGQNFGAVQPTVTLAGTPLTVQTFSQFFAVALLLPGTNQGSYRLVLVNNQSSRQRFLRDYQWNYMLDQTEALYAGLL